MINNEEEEGKGRSAKRPRERLKFQIFPTVVALLSLEQCATRMALTGQMPDESAIFAFDNGREASRCGQDWLRDRELLVLYRYQTS